MSDIEYNPERQRFAGQRDGVVERAHVAVLRGGALAGAGAAHAQRRLAHTRAAPHGCRRR